MMTMTTARLGLPLLAPGQAQKELFHNEALSAIDALLHAVVEAVGASEPPVDPAFGTSWILGAAPTGAWAGHAHALAIWTEGGWWFHKPVAGMRAVLRMGGSPVDWDGAAWRQGELIGARVMIGGRQVVGERGAAIPNPIGGATVDAESRAATVAILSVLRTHGLIA